MDHECVTGILVDLSDGDQPISSPAILMPKALIHDFDISDSELLENERFDFDLVHSPDCSFDEEDDILKKSPINKMQISLKDLTLTTKEMVEVFKEATVVAVTLENYVQQENKTPKKSPNLTTLLFERSAQKKLKSASLETVSTVSSKDCSTGDSEYAVDENESRKRISFSLQKPTKNRSPPPLKRLVSSASSRLSMPSIKKTISNNRAQSSSTSSFMKKGPVKATVETTLRPKLSQTHTTRNVSSSTKLNKSSVPNSGLSNSGFTGNSTPKASPTPEVPKTPVRPVLSRRNSDVATKTLQKPFVTPEVSKTKLQSRRSFGGASSCPVEVSVPKKAKFFSPSASKSVSSKVGVSAKANLKIAKLPIFSKNKQVKK